MLEAENIKGLEEDLAYWNELANLLGWKVYGFTYKSSASFDTGGMYHSTVQLTGYQRDDIVRAIRNAEETAKISKT
jgi:hypothetical protein